MEVRIGVVYSARELTFDTEESTEQVADRVDRALTDSARVLWLADTKGRRIGVPTDKIAYVEIAADAGERRVGFGPG